MVLSTTNGRRAALVAALATVPLALAAGTATATTGTDTGNAAAPVQQRVPAAERALAKAQSTSGTCAIGGIVWDDSSQDGLKTSGETGFAGSEVLLRWDGTTVLTSVTTGADGRYLFDGLQCGRYDVGFTLPSGYSWTTPDQGTGADDSQATDPGPSFIDGVTATFAVGPGEKGTRPTTAADGVTAGYLDNNVDAGLFVTGSAAVSPSTPALGNSSGGAGSAGAVQAPGAGAVAASGGLAYTGTDAENLGWTGAVLVALGAAMVLGTARRPQRVPVTG